MLSIVREFYGCQMYLGSRVCEENTKRRRIMVYISRHDAIAGARDFRKEFRVLRESVLYTAKNLLDSAMVNRQTFQLPLKEKFSTDRSDWTREPVF